MIKCSGFLLKTNWFPRTNLVPSQETHILSNLMDQLKFVKNWKIFLGSPYHFFPYQFFKGWFPYILLGAIIDPNPKKLFRDDVSLFSIIRNVCHFGKWINYLWMNYLYKINWAFQWKMGFNPDPSKQTQEIIFSRKTNKISHSSSCYNNSIVSQTSYQTTFDARLTFEEYLKVIITKIDYGNSKTFCRNRY